MDVLTVDLVTDERADLIVIATPRRGRQRPVMLGGVSEHVIRLAPCAVRAVREPA